MLPAPLLRLSSLSLALQKGQLFHALHNYQIVNIEIPTMARKSQLAPLVGRVGPSVLFLNSDRSRHPPQPCFKVLRFGFPRYSARKVRIRTVDHMNEKKARREKLSRLTTLTKLCVRSDVTPELRSSPLVGPCACRTCALDDNTGKNHTVSHPLTSWHTDTE